MITYALIPARSGSKGVKGKNLRKVLEKPLLAYSIEAALKTENIDRVIVSTDSQEIADIALRYGAEVPFIRPSEFAQDTSPDRAYIEHALNWFWTNEQQEPHFIALLRPTTPIRSPALLAQAIRMTIDQPSATALRSVHELSEPPQKMMQIQDGWLTGFFPEDPRDDYFNLPRQVFPKAYHPNGYIDIVKSDYIRAEKEKIFGPRMIGFVTPFSIELDSEADFDYLDFWLNKNPQLLSSL